MARLWHHRLGHPSAAIPLSIYKLKLTEDTNCPIVLNEDCPCYIKGKFRIKQFPKRSIYLPETDNHGRRCMLMVMGGRIY